MEEKRSIDPDFDMLSSQGYDVEDITRRDGADNHHSDEESNVLLLEYA
jgi:hypothetical protein